MPSRMQQMRGQGRLPLPILGLQSVTLVCGEAFIAAVSGPEAIGGYDSEVICSARTQVR